MKIEHHMFEFHGNLGAMVERTGWLMQIQAALRRSRVTALVGPRQAGKTTLARQIVPADSPSYFDLEDPRSLARLAEPMTALESLTGTVVIDEIQRRPDIFPVLRVLADRQPLRTRFLILGSASPELLRQLSETLAGRLETIVLSGFGLDELGSAALHRHWRRGGFPRAYLARAEGDSFARREQFIQTFLERDLPQIGFRLPAATLLRFWTMVAHYHGGVWNAAEPARSLGLSQPTVRRYLDLLSGLYMVRRLAPWHENLGKRQVKAPKIYLQDSGLLHALLGIRTERELLSHPKIGASFEGYVLTEVLRETRPDAAYFWATHTGAELDLLLFKGRRRYGVEIKYQDAPRMTPSMRIALESLHVETITVLYPGALRYSLAEQVEAVPVAELAGAGADILAGGTGRRRARRSPRHQPPVQGQ